MALKYSYRAKDSLGGTKNGIVEANSVQQASKILQDNKLLVISLTEKRELSISFLSGKLNKVSEKDLSQFTRLLSTMLSTGLPLIEAMYDLASETENTFFKEIISSISRDIQSGISMSVAMGRYPAIFNQLYLSIVRAGEASGKVDEALSSLADTLESQMEFKAKVKGALLYPVIIVIAMVGISMIMITQVIPKIAQVYKDFGAELPLPTRILLGIADFVANDFVIVLFLIIMTVVFYKILRRNKTSDYLMNNFYFKVPIFGKLTEEVQLTVMCHTLATLLHSGVGIIEALKITAGTLSNNYIRGGLLDAGNMVEKGLPLSAAMRNVSQYPVMIAQLVSVGEQTGTLDQSLSRLARFFQESSERKVKVLTTALEPVLILIMGSAVGGLAIAVLMPMFNLVNVIK